MMKSKESKESYWRRRVEQARRHPGGIAAYCKTEGLRPSAYYYWNKRLGSVAMSKVAETAFVPVTVSRSENDLPNPEWVARFVVEFLSQMQ